MRASSQLPRLSRHLSVGLACVLALSNATMGYRVMININQFPAMMVSNYSRWAGAVDNSDGVMGVGAPAVDDQMTAADIDTLLGYFGAKPKVLNTLWGFLTGAEKPSVNYTNFDAFVAKRWPAALNLAGAAGGPPPSMFVWDSGTVNKEPDGMLTLDDLNRLQKANYRKVLILVRGWGDGSDAAIAERKASILHPQTLGVVIEGNPDAFIVANARLPPNPRLGVAQFTKATGKPLYLLVPPGTQTGRAPVAWRRPMPDRMRDMLGNLTLALGEDYLCNGPLTILASAYGLGNITAPWLPALNPDGSIAPTYAGGVTYLNRHKFSRCPSV